jgi:hypothetical protein
MTGSTLLLRQIHPTFLHEGRVTSQAFRPTPKDEDRLSVDNGDLIGAAESWKRFVADGKCSSAGVMAVSHGECDSQALRVVEDGIPYPDHCCLDFSPFQKKEGEGKEGEAPCRFRAAARMAVHPNPVSPTR